MKDFLKKYHNKKIIWNAWIILASLVLAFWINTFIIDWTNIWDSLKSSIIDSKTNTIKADLYIENIENKILIKNWKDIQNIDTISLSIIYNPNNLDIKNIKSSYWEAITLWEKNTWSDTIIINIWNKNIVKNNTILELITNKKENKSEQLNLINVNFKDINWDKYDLSTSWITF